MLQAVWALHGIDATIHQIDVHVEVLMVSQKGDQQHEGHEVMAFGAQQCHTLHPGHVLAVSSLRCGVDCQHVVGPRLHLQGFRDVRGAREPNGVAPLAAALDDLCLRRFALALALALRCVGRVHHLPVDLIRRHRLVDVDRRPELLVAVGLFLHLVQVLLLLLALYLHQVGGLLELVGLPVLVLEVVVRQLHLRNGGLPLGGLRSHRGLRGRQIALRCLWRCLGQVLILGVLFCAFLFLLLRLGLRFLRHRCRSSFLCPFRRFRRCFRRCLSRCLLLLLSLPLLLGSPLCGLALLDLPLLLGLLLLDGLLLRLRLRLPLRSGLRLPLLLHLPLVGAEQVHRELPPPSAEEVDVVRPRGDILDEPRLLAEGAAGLHLQVGERVGLPVLLILVLQSKGDQHSVVFGHDHLNLLPGDHLQCQGEIVPKARVGPPTIPAGLLQHASHGPRGVEPKLNDLLEKDLHLVLLLLLLFLGIHLDLLRRTNLRAAMHELRREGHHQERLQLHDVSAEKV
mmetsp:Transcript_76115/g.182059  ORF Transcript_76115/g.182059 Transcript_76115/m.182059 type:complete len:510 (-) Transcript_76115:2684-4213(-)